MTPSSSHLHKHPPIHPRYPSYHVTVFSSRSSRPAPRTCIGSPSCRTLFNRPEGVANRKPPLPHAARHFVRRPLASAYPPAGKGKPPRKATIAACEGPRFHT
ncbi:hypothetical protein HYQ44_011169 [Verticillium longisporum]|nr:hypothetical protein HYQ44_011169 [Verticillium longisporum]